MYRSGGKKMKKYVFCPFEDNIHYNTDIQYNNIEDITDYTCNYAVLDALSLEYYFSIEFH